MKSIGIVYKKSRRDFILSGIGRANALNQIQENRNQIRESENKRQEIIEKIPSQKQKTDQIRDQRRIFSSVNGRIRNQPRSLLPDRKEQLYLPIKKVTVKKPQTNNFTIKIPQNSHQLVSDQITPRIKDLGKYPKLKIHGKIKNTIQTTIVVSVDFILNEENFWGSEAIEESSIKTWKTLMPIANLVWSIKRKDTIKKLHQFADQFKLRLDGIVEVDPAKKESLYVSYYPLEKELNLELASKLIVMNAIKTSDLQQVSDIQFKNSLPLTLHSSTFIHYVKINMSEKQRFGSVLKVLTQQPPAPMNLKSIQYSFERRKSIQIPMRQKNDFEIEEIDSLDLIEKSKRNVCGWFRHRIGLNTKIEGDSVQYLIGDMFRRNCRVFEKIASESQKKSTSPTKTIRKVEKKSNSLSYDKPVYLWQF